MHTKIKRILSQECGIPASRITFISGQFHSDPDEIIEVQERFNGDDENAYNIVIANKKAEVGINLQKGCQAIHHLELNWTPDSITQRNGRGIRQGNTAEKVHVYFYEADGTFDTYKRMAIDRKSNWIESVMSKHTQDGFAEVGQGLTEQDYTEMIDFDGTAAQFELMMKRQEERKQAELNRQALQVHTVNVGIIRAANQWLKNNGEFEQFITKEAREALQDSHEFQSAQSRLRKSISSRSSRSTIDKNQKGRNKAFERMQYWQQRFDGITCNLPSGASVPVVGYHEERDDFELHIWHHFVYDKSHALYQEWQKECQKQMALRQSALHNAIKNAHIKGAMPEAALNELVQGHEPFSYKGVHYPRGSIVQTPSHIVFLKDWKGHSVYYRSRQQIYSVDTFFRGTEDPEKVWLPDDADYMDGIKALAQWQSQYFTNIPYRYKEYLPSVFLPNVFDYLSEEAKNYFKYNQ